MHEKPPLVTEQAQKAACEDVGVIRSSLSFINDLLRSMLDVHRAANKQLKIEATPTDILSDILHPVASILYHRGDTFQVLVECDDHLVARTDRIRLKQIVLNLANNSRKFVQKGYIRMRASRQFGLAQSRNRNWSLLMQKSGRIVGW